MRRQQAYKGERDTSRRNHTHSSRVSLSRDLTETQYTTTLMLIPEKVLKLSPLHYTVTGVRSIYIVGRWATMKPPRFRYCAPDMLDEALSLLDKYGEDAKVLAGGQSLIPLLNMRLTGPAYVLDINHISELNYIETEDGYLAVGATVRQRQGEAFPLFKEQDPVVVVA